MFTYAQNVDFTLGNQAGPVQLVLGGNNVNGMISNSGFKKLLLITK